MIEIGSSHWKSRIPVIAWDGGKAKKTTQLWFVSELMT